MSRFGVRVKINYEEVEKRFNELRAKGVKVNRHGKTPEEKEISKLYDKLRHRALKMGVTPQIPLPDSGPSPMFLFAPSTPITDESPSSLVVSQ